MEHCSKARSLHLGSRDLAWGREKSDIHASSSPKLFQPEAQVTVTPPDIEDMLPTSSGME